jgi:hypothetical protein
MNEFEYLKKNGYLTVPYPMPKEKKIEIIDIEERERFLREQAEEEENRKYAEDQYFDVEAFRAGQN